MDSLETFARVMGIEHTKYTHDRLQTLFSRVQNSVYYHDHIDASIHDHDRYVFRDKIPLGHSFVYMEKQSTFETISLCYGKPITEGYVQNYLLPVQNKTLHTIPRVQYHVFVFDPAKLPQLNYKSPARKTNKATSKTSDLRRILVNLVDTGG